MNYEEIKAMLKEQCTHTGAYDHVALNTGNGVESVCLRCMKSTVESGESMGLNETVALMNSDDYKDRFIGEYAQLAIRINGLKKMLDNWDKGTLVFEPKASHETLIMQLYFMEKYAEQLVSRAEQESIELPNI